MRSRHNPAFLLMMVGSVACQGTESASLETDDQKASYAIGLDIGSSLAPTGDHLDVPALRAGLEDALAERESRIPEAELQTVMQAFSETLRAEQQAEVEAQRAQNIEEGTTYLAENGAREGVSTTASGLQYEILEAGDGPSPEPTDRVTIHYRGTLVDGSQFDSSYEGDTPATFSVGGVIPGFSEALQLMSVGSHFRFVIPSAIGYGPQGNPPDIGPDATLIFEVELLEIPEG